MSGCINYRGEAVAYDLEILPGGRRGRITAPGYRSAETNLTLTDPPKIAYPPVILWLDSDLVDVVEAEGLPPLPVEEVASYLMRACALRLGVGQYFTAAPILKLTDRTYWPASSTIKDTFNLGVWREDPNKGRGHVLPCLRCVGEGRIEPNLVVCPACDASGQLPGWRRIGSWRSRTHIASLQATLYKGPGGALVVELDIDRMGLSHWGDVLHNVISGDKTDVIWMAQVVAWAWGLQLPFEFRLRV